MAELSELAQLIIEEVESGGLTIEGLQEEIKEGQISGTKWEAGVKEALATIQPQQ